jgi:hypothetical protein
MGNGQGNPGCPCGVVRDLFSAVKAKAGSFPDFAEDFAERRAAALLKRETDEDDDSEAA